MPEPLKNLYNEVLLNNLSREVSNRYPEFDSEGFSRYVLDDDWDNKELKERMKHITVALGEFIHLPYGEAVSMLSQASSQFSGFEYMFFPGFVELYGMDHLQESIAAMEAMTPYSSAEFAVRPFIKQYPEEMLDQLLRWSKSDNYHVRRLASEGCRPRLPWAMALPAFKRDPQPILPILENLKHDDSEFVRRSVANNLNDISKDHPDIVIEIAKRWLGDNNDTDRLVKHACRTLLKQGVPEVMTLFNYSSAEHFEVSGLTVTDQVHMGEAVEFSFTLSNNTALGKLRLEYAVGFLRKNGSHSKKVFKISETEVESTTKQVTRRHSFKPITTRTYYSGTHYLTIIANGVELAEAEFLLS